MAPSIGVTSPLGSLGRQACLRRSAMLETLSDEQISQLADASGVPGRSPDGPRTGPRTVVPGVPGGSTCTVTRRGLVHMASWGKHRKARRNGWKAKEHGDLKLQIDGISWDL